MLILLGFAMVVFVAAGLTVRSLQTKSIPLEKGVPMLITSPAFQEGQTIPIKYTCDDGGDNLNPPLAFANTPAQAKSLALIMDDPDSPGGVFNHWLLWNIDPLTTQIAEGSTPSGSVVGTTSFGDQGYGGPCPGIGQHRYQFKIYALDTTLDLPESATQADLEPALKGHILGSGKLTGVYMRQK